MGLVFSREIITAQFVAVIIVIMMLPSEWYTHGMDWNLSCLHSDSFATVPYKQMLVQAHAQRHQAHTK
jgi:hypothetical protein